MADSSKANHMQRYCKTDMPMYGVQKQLRAQIEKKLYEFVSKQHSIEKKDSLPLPLYQEYVQTLWDLSHREEKYLAIDLAQKYKHCVGLETLSLYEKMLREDFMWWDLVDPIATGIIGALTMDYRQNMEPILNAWIDDDNMWIRRTAILSQLKHKDQTNGVMLFKFCRCRMHEQEFFIRKAIGWALREYSKTNPEGVNAFLTHNKCQLSGLSHRTASRILVKEGKM